MYFTHKEEQSYLVCREMDTFGDTLYPANSVSVRKTNTVFSLLCQSYI